MGSIKKAIGAAIGGGTVGLGLGVIVNNLLTAFQVVDQEQGNAVGALVDWLSVTAMSFLGAYLPKNS